MIPADPAVAGGWLLPLALMLPALALMAGFASGGRRAEVVALVALPPGCTIAATIAALVWLRGQEIAYTVGGWGAPLGLVLRVDGFAAAMLLVTAIVVSATAIFARADFPTPPGQGESRAALTFWTLLPGLWLALNAVILGGDLFNLYVALELLTFAAVPLVCLDGRRATLKAALRYLIFALLGSVLYLLGVALLYGAHGILDIPLLAARLRPEPVTWLAAAMMTAGLLAKTALFPLHFWLPPAHAGAPPAASAMLSALVVKASFILLLRLWFDLFPGLATTAAAQLLAGMGAAAILFGSVLALRQARLKLLIAYSTVAQIGYLFLMIPLAGGDAAAAAWTGGLLQAISHAFAKAAMFLAAGLLAGALGHDRIAGLGGTARAMPMTILVFALSGLTLMGVPPSGGFAAKWLLMTAALTTGQWWWALVMLAGGLLTGGYVFRVLAMALAPAPEQASPPSPVPWPRASAALVLALCSVLLGLLPFGAFGLLMVGRP